MSIGLVEVDCRAEGGGEGWGLRKEQVGGKGWGMGVRRDDEEKGVVRRRGYLRACGVCGLWLLFGQAKG